MKIKNYPYKYVGMVSMLIVMLSSAEAQSEDEGVTVCVNSDGVMKKVTTAQDCKPGDDIVLLAEWEPEEPEELESKDDPRDGATQLSMARMRIEELTQRVLALENRIDNKGKKNGNESAQQVNAPFEVIGADGGVLLRVTDEPVGATGDGARTVIGLEDDAGLIQVYGQTGSPAVLVGVVPGGPGLVSVADAQGRYTAELDGAGAVNVRSGSAILASMSRDKGFRLLDSGGVVRAAMETIADDPAIRVYNEAGKPLVELTHLPGGHGFITAADSGGKWNTQMEGYGSVSVSQNDITIAAMRSQPPAAGEGGVGLRVYNTAGEQVVAAGEASGEGYLATMDGDGGGSASVTMGGGMVAVWRNNSMVASMLAENLSGGGAGGFRLFSGDDRVIASIGADEKGFGVVGVLADGKNFSANMVADGTMNVFASSKLVSSMRYDPVSDAGLLAIYNNGKTPVGFLTSSSNKLGGNITMRTNDGVGIFSAGAASDGGGEACINRIAGSGKEIVACLGLGLPSMGLTK